MQVYICLLHPPERRQIYIFNFKSVIFSYYLKGIGTRTGTRGYQRIFENYWNRTGTGTRTGTGNIAAGWEKLHLADNFLVILTNLGWYCPYLELSERAGLA